MECLKTKLLLQSAVEAYSPRFLELFTSDEPSADNPERHVYLLMRSVAQEIIGSVVRQIRRILLQRRQKKAGEKRSY